jgi:hypothetical protein
VDRHRPPDEVADVYMHVEKETDAGLIVSGAKVVATGSALTHYNFVAHPGIVPTKDLSMNNCNNFVGDHVKRVYATSEHRRDSSAALCGIERPAQ